jgi:hypothetical protein
VSGGCGFPNRLSRARSVLKVFGSKFADVGRDDTAR